MTCSLLLAACATPQRQVLPGESAWMGRLALTVQTEPVQSVTAGFDLRGSPASGRLLLTSPLGNAVASVAWTETDAEWRQGDQVVKKRNLEELTTELGGTALPVAALFAWLNGTALEADGWQADLSRYKDGRITAKRNFPLPSAELRLILQP
ncbi:MAG: lipoprotein insertase outer membrane protein LolB [Hydrogenophaga sp.]|nr:lipoprotein insertase outer membrane protein LolB [Hydrogenophaga sp.]